ncbi:hypothetical protein [uncultured Roseobacter sp.]|uniref:hypothetical protein n=1 Tax=uncultured Roseobacter sp. TaxID=114847 RepID=UPI002637707E|nr:hypothetical protein [uncultured Roseobacter sp.]
MENEFRVVSQHLQSSSEKAHVTPLWLFVLATVVPLFVIIILANQSVEMRGQAFRDTYSAVRRMRTGQFPPYLGIVSNLGIVIWCAAWAVTGFISLVMFHKRAIRLGLFLLSQSVITGILVADDLLLMHEMVYPRFGIDEVVVFAVYICLVGLWVGTFRLVISFIGAGLLILSGLGFACSIVGDMLEGTQYHVPMMDGSGKLFGIFFWTAFALRGCWVLLETDRATPFAVATQK